MDHVEPVIEVVPVELPRVRLPVPVLIDVAADPEVLIFVVPVMLAVPPETVIPADPVSSPAEVIVPLPVVKMFPVVERVPADETVSCPVDPTFNNPPVAVVVPIATFP